MTIVFLTNMLTPHQLPLSLQFCKMTEKYFLIECENSDKKEIPIGWMQKGDFDFVVSYQKLKNNINYYIELINKADIVIFGGYYRDLLRERLKGNKLTFNYSERVYKKGCFWYELPLRAIKYYWQFGRYKKLYLLCASAYTAGDYAKTGTFINKAFKWGYFPETKEYDIEKLVAEKTPNTITWAARLIDWKHPELAVEVARRLKEDGFDFTLNIIGTGELHKKTERAVVDYGLQKEVRLLGAIPPEEVRSYMEKSEIFLMTSDRQEGWGAVLNEAMNSGCAVVANSATGSAPFLIEDGENGFLYSDRDFEALYQKVKFLLLNPDQRKQISKRAYFTILEQWNAENAANRLIKLSNEILKNGKLDVFSDNGLCSKTC